LSGKIKKRSSGRFFYAVGKKLKRFTYLLKRIFGQFDLAVNRLTQGFAACLIPSADFSALRVMSVLLHSQRKTPLRNPIFV